MPNLQNSNAAVCTTDPLASPQSRRRYPIATPGIVAPTQSRKAASFTATAIRIHSGILAIARSAATSRCGSGLAASRRLREHRHAQPPQLRRQRPQGWHAALQPRRPLLPQPLLGLPEPGRPLRRRNQLKRRVHITPGCPLGLCRRYQWRLKRVLASRRLNARQSRCLAAWLSRPPCCPSMVAAAPIAAASASAASAASGSAELGTTPLPTSSARA